MDIQTITPNVINLNGTLYLGVHDGNAVIGVEARNVDSAIDDFIKAANAEELIVVTLGDNIGLAIKPLNKAQLRRYKTRVADMAEVKAQRVAVIENKLFDGSL